VTIKTSRRSPVPAKIARSSIGPGNRTLSGCCRLPLTCARVGRIFDALLSADQENIMMQVHTFRGTGRVFGFTEDATGVNLPSRFGPWSHFKVIDLSRDGAPTAGVNSRDCLDDLENYGFHITDAHVRITETLI
jgi:hypothetical protein